MPNHWVWLCCRCMSDMAKMGMTVVAVIHQPRFSSFDLFDTVSTAATCVTHVVALNRTQHWKHRPRNSVPQRGKSDMPCAHMCRWWHLLLTAPLQVLLLGQGGCTVYNGPPRVAVAYFQYALGFMMPELENPADILMDIISGKLPTTKSKSFKPKDLVRGRARARSDTGTELVTLLQLGYIDASALPVEQANAALPLP